jgi:Rps23 Pro-64 3,4-dihydroxylase Tpa1-like proline 4-hydroxylase
VEDLGHRRLCVVPDFFAEADEMRAVFDERFARARPHGPESFIWDYWHVPGQYTYLRTFGDRYFPDSLTKGFLERLKAWGRDVLGCSAITAPWLSYYVEGCVQELHADVPNGPWAYVFSLTRWDGRSFQGGETEMLRPELLDFWRRFDPSEGLETRDMVDRIPPEFNQLTVFDARIPHAVRAVRGTHDPIHSRVVLHGWFDYPKLALSDDMGDERAHISLRLAAAHIVKRLQRFKSVTGLLTVRVEFGDDGHVRATRVLTNTLVSAVADGDAPAEIVASVRDALDGLEIAGASSQSWAIVPIRMPLHA